MPTPISGKTGSIKIASTNIGFKNWKLTGDGNPEVDVTTFDSAKTALNGQTVKQVVYPIFEGRVTITGALDAAKLPFDAPMQFLPDTQVTLILGLTTLLAITVPAKCKKFVVGTAVDGFADFEGEFIVTADPTYP